MKISNRLLYQVPELIVPGCALEIKPCDQDTIRWDLQLKTLFFCFAYIKGFLLVVGMVHLVHKVRFKLHLLDFILIQPSISLFHRGQEPLSEEKPWQPKHLWLLHCLNPFLNLLHPQTEILNEPDQWLNTRVRKIQPSLGNHVD